MSNEIKYNTIPKKYFYYLKLISTIAGVWPLKIDCKRIHIFIYKIHWYISFFNIMMMIIPLFLGVYNFHNNSIKSAKSMCEAITLSDVSLNLLYSRIKSQDFQEIFKKIENLFESTEYYQQLLLQKYTNKYKKTDVVIFITLQLTSLMFICKPFFTSDHLPGSTWYPFSYKDRPIPIKFFLYAVHSMSSFQCSFSVAMDLMIATIFLYITVQVELLKEKVNQARNKQQLVQCARSHQKLITFINEMKNTVQILIVKANISMTLIFVTAAIQLIHKDSLQISITFIFMVLSASSRIYITAVAANDLHESGKSLAQRAFETAFMQESLSNAKIGLMLAFRCQKPLVISITGIINAYDLQHFLAFLSTSISYFINLRAVING